MQSFDFKKLLPHLLIVLGFLVLSLIFCYPSLEGKILHQGDNVSWKGVAHEAIEWHKKTGENTLWSNSMFGGMPTYTSYVPESKNYVSYITYVLTDAVLSKPAYFFFLAMLGFYILMCALRINRWLGIGGAIAYAFATYNPGIIAAGHDTKMIAIAYMPAVLAGMMMLYRRQYLAGTALLGIAFALIVSSNHYQVVYYEVIIMGFAAAGMLVAAIMNKEVKGFLIASVITAVICVVALGPSAAGLLSVKEYQKETMRGGTSELTFNHDKGKKNGGLDRDYAFLWSNSIGETFCILVPYLYGGSSAEDGAKAPKTAELVGQDEGLPLYWGPQPFLAGPAYLGAVICFLFVLGMFVVRSPHKWWILGASILGLIMSTGKNMPGINNFLFDHLPMYNKFRTPTMSIVIPQLLFPMLGIWAVNDIMKGTWSKEELWKKTKLALGITAGLCVLIGIAGGMFFDFSSAGDSRYPAQLVSALKDDRSSLAMKSAFTSAIYILIAGGLIWALIREKIKPAVFTGCLCALIAIDLISVAAHYLNDKNYQDASDYETNFQPRPVDMQILQDKDPYYRVLDLSRDVYNDAIQAYFHKCVGGYSPAKLEIYQDLIDVHMSKKFNAQVLNMLNTKYIIFSPGQNAAPVVQQNPDACGNAWFVNEVKWAKTADEEMLSLNAAALGDTVKVADAFEPKKTAVIRETFKEQLNGYTFGKDSSAKVLLDQYGLNNISFRSDNSQNGLAVFSDIYYAEGWKAYVDDKETPILKADYVLRAIKIPSGKHKIEFRFHPDSYYNGNKIAVITSLILFGLIGAALFMAFKGKKEQESAA
ncbi:YfhO family protein [Chitinophagaceae bacterium MMS25-I14]